MDIVQGLLRRLATLAVGLSLGGAPDVANALETIPVRAVTDVLADAEDWETLDRLRLAFLLAHDRRAAVRTGVADSLRERPPAWGRTLDAILSRLSADSSAEVRRAAAASLSRCINHVPPLERIGLVARWAFDPQPERREVTATALAGCLDVVGARTALEYLLDDASPQVRRAAAAALARR